MEPANAKIASAFAWMRLCILLWCVVSSPAGAVGTPVGTVIENTADVSYDLNGSLQTVQSNTATLEVAERINVAVTLQSPETPVDPGESGRALLFNVTNIGNGTETFRLSMDSVIAGDDFDPVPAVPGIYFDTDASGDFNAGDQPYEPGTNDPVLLADESISVLVVNDIPAGVANAATGRTELTATSATGTGSPGTVFTGLGDGGVNAVAGLTGGEATDAGEYLVSGVLLNIAKSQVVTDPFGGSEPIPGATITYTITVDVASAGTATGSVLRDRIPEFSTYVANSITLNGSPLSDAIDGDAGELDTTTESTVVIRLGDLAQTDATQTIVFKTLID